MKFEFFCMIWIHSFYQCTEGSWLSKDLPNLKNAQVKIEGSTDNLFVINNVIMSDWVPDSKTVNRKYYNMINK